MAQQLYDVISDFVFESNTVLENIQSENVEVQNIWQILLETIEKNLISFQQQTFVYDC